MYASQLPMPLQVNPVSLVADPLHPSTRRTRSNGSANKLAPEDAPAHEWYRFVLSFPPHLVRDYIGRFSVGRDHTVMDPFCGTGTTLVECKKLGIPSVGIEANPMAHFAASTKTDWTPDPEALSSHARHIANNALRELAAQGLEDVPAEVSSRSSIGTLDALPPESHSLLLTNSISELPLHKTLLLLRSLADDPEASFDRHEKLALAQALVSEISNLHFGPEVGVGKVKRDAPVIGPWLTRVERIANDLRSLGNGTSTCASAILGDSRSLPETLSRTELDAVITSPPYPNEKDYTRTTRLESVILGFVNSKDELRSLKRSFIRSNTRSVYKDDQDHAWVAGFPRIGQLADEIESRRRALGKTSGFERMYSRVTLLYFGGMARHFESLRELLRPGAMLAYVVGDQASYLRVMIRTGQLLADIARSLGYEVVGIDLFRTRTATATREQLREEVLVLRWPG